MRNSKSAYLFTYNNIWKLVSISNINAVSIPPSLLNSLCQFTVVYPITIHVLYWHSCAKVATKCLLIFDLLQIGADYSGRAIPT